MIILRKHILVAIFTVYLYPAFSQVDSLAKVLIDTIKGKITDDEIPSKTFKDKFMYPHRLYVKYLLAPKKPYLDTSYIKSNKRKLTITVPIAKKYYGFNFIDLEQKKALKFSPNNYYHLGFNFSNIIVTFGFYPGIKFGAKEGKGKTTSRDYQVTFIGRKVITDVNYQRYRGFYLFNTKDYEVNVLDADNVVIRPDINVFSFGVNTMFIFNDKKYSLRGAFSFTDVQRKSAGSFMAGLYHSYTLITSGKSPLIPQALDSVFSPKLYAINKISLITVGLSAGYGYTFVYKKIILSSAVNVGFGGQKTNYTTTDDKGHTLSINPSVHLNAKAAIRYDNLRFFIGLLSSYDNNYTLNPELFNTESYIARLVVFSGYRFNIKQNGSKVLRAMGLIDYN
ncbi:hypothetical protein CNR22_03025 [Sphingobacteriaceae bacterium]|nr:hypothetical protein CNR22_03025 [Sphingobacteriaceae bacterium]